MAVVMKQLDRSDEAIEAIKSFRNLCPSESQESIDNILIELYKVRAYHLKSDICIYLIVYIVLCLNVCMMTCISC